MNEKPTTTDRYADAALEIGRGNREQRTTDRTAYTPRPIAPRSQEIAEAPKVSEHKKAKKKPSFGVTATAALVGAGMIAGVGASEAYDNYQERATFDETVTEMTLHIPDGGTITSEAVIQIKNYFASNGLEESRIPYETITSEANKAGREYEATTGKEYIPINEIFMLEILENDFGNYSVSVNPLITYSPDVPETSTGN